MTTVLATGAVFESYRVLGMLATGHMGAVYSVEEVDGGKQRALKLIHSKVVLPGFDATDFDRVMSSGRQLDREHYVEVVETGLDATQQTPWVVMQLLRGDNSKARVASKGPLSAPHLTELFNQVCRALQKAHDQRLAHGDLKPENVFMASARRVGMPFSINLLDYGVARFVDTGEKLWKPPEQQPGNCADPRLDVWPLGLIAFYLLTGRSFWDSPDATDPSHGRAVVPPASHAALTLGVALPYPHAFDTWFQRCVALDPNERFENAAAVMKGLRRVLSGSPLADKQRGAAILGGRSHAASVPDVDRAAPGRVSQMGGAPTHPAPHASSPTSAGHPPTQHSPAHGASQQYPPTEHAPPPTGATPPTPSAAPTQAAYGAPPTPSAAPTQAAATPAYGPPLAAPAGAYGPPPSVSTPGATAPATPAAVAPAAAPASLPTPVSTPHVSAAATHSAATQQATADAAGPASAAASSSQVVSAAQPAPTSQTKGGALALGGCAVGVVVAVGGGILLLVILVFVLVAIDDDGRTDSDGTGSSVTAAAARIPVVGDEIEIKQEVEAEFTAPGRGKAKLTESNHRRARVLTVTGSSISRAEIEYLIKRSTINGQAQPEPTQGKKYVVDISGGASTISLPGGGSPPAAELKSVKTDGLDVAPASSLDLADLKVGESVPAPAGTLGSGGMDVKRATMTYRGSKKEGATSLALFDVTLDLAQNEDGMTMTAKLSGSATIAADSKRLVSMELKGPVTIKAAQGTGTGFMKLNETRSYTDKN